MIDFEKTSKAVLTFLDGEYETIRVTGVVFNVDGLPMWFEGYPVNVIGPKPNPITVYPWSALRSVRPL